MEDNITLREGLERFHKEQEHHLSHNKKGVSSEAKAFFRSHDITHVLLGCDISVYGEATIKIWTIFGTTLGFWKQMHAYTLGFWRYITANQNATAFELSKKITFADILNNMLKFLISIPKIILSAKQMHKPWDWTKFEPYLDMPISEIRKEFNIKVLR